MGKAKYANLSRGEIARKFISPEQNKLLGDFFGRGIEGAEKRLVDFEVPKGLTKNALEAYLEIARRTIDTGLDKQGVQRLRLKLVEKALAELEK